MPLPHSLSLPAHVYAGCLDAAKPNPKLTLTPTVTVSLTVALTVTVTPTLTNASTNINNNTNTDPRALMQGGLTPLMVAVKASKLQVLKLFLEHKADINVKNDMMPVRTARGCAYCRVGT